MNTTTTKPRLDTEGVIREAESIAKERAEQYIRLSVQDSKMLEQAFLLRIVDTFVDKISRVHTFERVSEGFVEMRIAKELSESVDNQIEYMVLETDMDALTKEMFIDALKTLDDVGIVDDMLKRKEYNKGSDGVEILSEYVMMSL